MFKKIGKFTTISIHALRGEGDQANAIQPLDCTISIHALRGEGDACHCYGVTVLPISIHALRGEGDSSALRSLDRHTDFNPRPPWGGRRKNLSPIKQTPNISIHALRGEGD